MSISQIHQRLEAILGFMQPYWGFVNCHMVNFLTDYHWLNYIPQKLQNEVPTLEKISACIETVFWKKTQTKCEEFPAFRDFLKQTEQHRLRNFPELLTNLDELQNLLNINGNSENLSIKEFMCEKKNHEVEIMSSLINDLMKSFSQRHHNAELYVVDAGDGKGYLSSRLALQYKFKVLGIDANEANTSSALQRNQRLKKAWNGLTRRAELEKAGLNPNRRENFIHFNSEPLRTFDNYKTTSKFITTDLNLNQLLNQHFPSFDSSKELPFCLSGLHTCGNLASTCLQVFHAQNECKILCNIGCCYHLIKEAFSTKEFFGNKEILELQTSYGFPLSHWLYNKKFSLGRNARMLASQSIERTLNAQELPNDSLFYRALLEVLICEEDPTLRDQIQVGKIRKSQNFQHYFEQCQKKLPGSLAGLTNANLEALQKKYAQDRSYLDLFYLIRMSFAPILETLILLDRLLYLKENGYDRSYLVPLFDPIISPRHYAIIAFKN